MCYEGLTIRVRNTFLFSSLTKNWDSSFVIVHCPWVILEGVHKIPCGFSSAENYPYLHPEANITGISLLVVLPSSLNLQCHTKRGRIGFRIDLFTRVELDTWLYR